MTKQEFIQILQNHASNASIFGGRFVRYGDNDDNWSYTRPAVDCFEPTIDLSIEGQVKYLTYMGFDLDKTETYTYDEFIDKYFLK
jgi:hypothetical protein